MGKMGDGVVSPGVTSGLRRELGAAATGAALALRPHSFERRFERIVSVELG